MLSAPDSIQLCTSIQLCSHIQYEFKCANKFNTIDYRASQLICSHSMIVIFRSFDCELGNALGVDMILLFRLQVYCRDSGVVSSLLLMTAFADLSIESRHCLTSWSKSVCFTRPASLLSCARAISSCSKWCLRQSRSEK